MKVFVLACLLSACTTGGVLSADLHLSNYAILLQKRSPLPVIDVEDRIDFYNHKQDHHDDRARLHPPHGLERKNDGKYINHQAQARKWADRSWAAEVKNPQDIDKQVQYYREKIKTVKDDNSKEKMEKELHFWEQLYTSTTGKTSAADQSSLSSSLHGGESSKGKEKLYLKENMASDTKQNDQIDKEASSTSSAKEGPSHLAKRSPSPVLEATTVQKMLDKFEDRIDHHDRYGNSETSEKWYTRRIAVKTKSHQLSKQELAYYKKKQASNKKKSLAKSIEKKLDFWEQFHATTIPMTWTPAGAGTRKIMDRLLVDSLESSSSKSHNGSL